MSQVPYREGSHAPVQRVGDHFRAVQHLPFGWFQVRFGPAGPSIDSAHAETSRQQLLRLVSSQQEAFGVAPRQTVIASFSQCGIMSAGLALTQPRQVGGFGLLSGRILPEIAPLITAAGELQAIEDFVSLVEHDDELPLEYRHTTSYRSPPTSF
ncbi:alpha/beta hydrolase [Cupriavidus sp. CuC1]|uniref:alpha/beta hydrolase n=1 Tax=Cupriavidus sp. CuC1 TaxID=3373131 RepID=UPI0037D6C1C5